MVDHERVPGTGKVIVLMRSDIAPELEVDYNLWYNEVHMPELLQLPGYLYARRFRTEEMTPAGQPRYVAVYELADAAILKSDAYLSIVSSDETRQWVQRFTKGARQVYQEIHTVRREGAEGTGNTIVVTRTDVPPELEEEYNQWYNNEHLPALLDVPGYLHARRFFDPETSPGAELRYLTIYELEDAAALTSPLRQKARQKDTRAPSFLERFTGQTRQVCREIFDSRHWPQRRPE